MQLSHNYLAFTGGRKCDHVGAVIPTSSHCRKVDVPLMVEACMHVHNALDIRDTHHWLVRSPEAQLKEQKL